VECGPTAGQISGACDELVREIAKAYARVTWYMPSVLADLRAHACADIPRLKGDALPSLSQAACRKLQVGKADPVRSSSDAFKDFMNAYASYRRDAKVAAQQRTVVALGKSAEVFYWETRKLGCVLVFAKMSNVDSEQQEGIAQFCSEYLLGARTTNRREWLDWPGWFKSGAGQPPGGGPAVLPAQP
jgi:hypothetical protein